MKYGLLIGAAGVALCASGPALADVTVTGTVDVEKTISVNEDVLIDTDVDLDVLVDLEAEKFAESTAIVNQSNYDNEACTNCAEKEDLIDGSGNGNAGMVSLNQSSGNMNNQGTLVSIAIDADQGGENGDPGNSGFAESLAAADQRNGSPDALAGEDGSFSDGEGGNLVETVNVLFRNADINNSFNGNTGLVYGNQATGNMGNQANILSLAFALDDNGVAISEADLGQVNANNIVRESSSENDGFGILKVATVSGSLNGNTGIVGVNQSVGNMSNQANIVSISAVGSDLPTF
ncbi:hypothetical protein [Altererythrobacter aquiaggeris]|uniref:hypothetical protein n=1 Tax=Aestuarierythrobacter aquiaggeris TaxID=1898396 RepID=UPI00301A55C2